MSNLPKYARRYVDDLTNFTAVNCRVKKKELIKKITNSSYDSFFKYVTYASSSVIKPQYSSLVSLLSELDSVYSYDNSLHFCINDIPSPAAYNAFTAYDWDKDIFVDFRYEGVECYLHAWKRVYPTVLKDNVIKYNLALFVDSPAMKNFNNERFRGQYPRIGDFMQTYKLNLNADGSHYECEVHPRNEYLLRKAGTIRLTYTSQGELAHLIDGASIPSNLNIPSPEIVLQVLNHVMYCYENRDVLTRKNGKAHKQYNTCTVHTRNDADVTKDIYIPLVTYVQNERKTSEYKGGHHASPSEHDRNGFYRKSRGRGNYDLVDGKMVWVGDMNGKYSYVPPTHVSGKKSKAVKIYKV